MSAHGRHSHRSCNAGQFVKTPLPPTRRKARGNGNAITRVRLRIQRRPKSRLELRPPRALPKREQSPRGGPHTHMTGSRNGHCGPVYSAVGSQRCCACIELRRPGGPCRRGRRTTALAWIMEPARTRRLRPRGFSFRLRPRIRFSHKVRNYISVGPRLGPVTPRMLPLPRLVPGVSELLIEVRRKRLPRLCS